ncbi:MULTISPECIES: EpsG family protein [unclassified Myroides]|uniref:EpsG family protein n=1 Tax=unclassified Myroides TaxID=2642485 RepID=UPI00310109A4
MIKESNFRKRSLIPFLIFLISPIFSLPFILHDVYFRKRGALFILAMFMGILTYLLLPDWSLDIARYYRGYQEMEYFSLKDFLSYLETRTDYVFYLLFFIFNKLSAKFQLLLFCLSTFNFFVFFYLFDHIIGKKIVNNRVYFFSFIFYFFSITILYYLSGTRYVLGCSFFLLSILFFYFKDSKLKGGLFFVLSLLTHIGVLIYLPVFILIYKVKNRKLMIKLSCVTFVLFTLIPVQGLLSLISPILPGFSNKAIIYINEVRDTNWSILLSYFITISIGLFFLVKYYVLLPKTLLNVLLLVLLPVVITIPFGFLVYDRYVMNFKPILVISLIYICTTSAYVKHMYSLILLRKILYLSFILYFIFSVYLYRHNIKPYFTIENLFLYKILQTTYTLKDIFYL